MQQPLTIPQSPAPLPPDSNSLPVNLPDPPQSGRWRGAISTIAILIAAPLLALALTSFVFQSYEVDGPSMEASLQHKDRLIVLKVPRTVARITKHAYIPERGSIVIFVKHGLSDFGEGTGDKQLIKRVVGLPGERVVVRDGAITIYNNHHPYPG